jgi:CRP-like cAMP-binding protein
MMVEMIDFLITLITCIHFLHEATGGIAAGDDNTKELRRGQVWLQEGAECDRICFVMRGLLKLYFDEGDREVISILRQCGRLDGFGT